MEKGKKKMKARGGQLKLKRNHKKKKPPTEEKSKKPLDAGGKNLRGYMKRYQEPLDSGGGVKTIFETDPTVPAEQGEKLLTVSGAGG